MHLSRHTLILAGIVFIYTVLIVLYAGITPAWESPDEPAHYLYTAHLGKTWQPPGPSSVRQTGPFYANGYITSNYEWYHPAGGYLWQAIGWRALNAVDSTLIPDEFPPVNLLFEKYPIPSPHLFLPERTGLFAPTADDVGLTLLRIFSGLLSVPIVIAVYGGARLVESERSEMALTAAGLVAFVPQFTFISGTLRNDTAANLMSALTVVLLLRIIQKPVERPRLWGIGIGGVLGVTMLTKALTWVLLPVVLLAVWLTPYGRRRRAELTLLFTGSTAIIVGGYYALWPETRQSLLYSLTHAEIQPGYLSLSYVGRIPHMFMHLFWGRFGWANVSLPETWVVVPTILACAGIAITLLYWTYARRSNQLAFVTHKQLVILTAVIVFNLGSVLRYNLYTYQPQGRFLFTSLLPLSIMCLWGFWQLLQLRRVRVAVAVSLVGALLVLNVGALFHHLLPAYYERWLPAAANVTPYNSDTSLTVSPSTTIGQTFEVLYPVLQSIDVAYDAGTLPSDGITLHVRESPASDEDIAVARPTNRVIQGKYHRFLLPAVRVPPNQQLYFFLEVSTQANDDVRMIEVHRSMQNGYDAGTLYIDGTPRAGDLNFVVFGSLDSDSAPALP